MDHPIGIIAGDGKLPLMVAKGIHAAGHKVACVGFRNQFDASLMDHCDYFDTVGLTRLNAWIRKLKAFGVSQAVMVGKVHKTTQYDPLRYLYDFPDWRTLRILLRMYHRDNRTATLLTAVANELSKKGIELMDSTHYIKEHLASEGAMTKRQLNAKQQNDIAFGWPMAIELNIMDIGQALAVKNADVIAVEAIEGTDAMIKRAGELCKEGGWTLIKTAKPNQDMRLDVPTVGPATIENLHQAGGRCLVIETEKVILAEKQKLLELADRYKMVVYGKKNNDTQ